MTAVRLKGVVKSYGRVRALDDLSLVIPRGSVCGVVGPNGSGKTTLFSTIAGLTKVDRGEIDVLEKGPFRASVSSGRLGLMPQDSVPSQSASLRENLQYYAELQGLTARNARSQVNECLASVRLEDKADARFSQLSHGMKRRFAIGQALLGDPELILLDEPSAGLDPELAADMRGLFLEQRGRATLVISSHILSELEAVCDYIVVLEKGRLVQQGPLAEFMGAGQLVSVELSGIPDLERLGGELPVDFSCKWHSPQLSVQFPQRLETTQGNALVLRAVMKQAVGIVRVEPGQSLERSYLDTRRRISE